MIDFSPRPDQQQVLSYMGGKMGVSAVPGSGKTWTLSLLAAEIISRDYLGDDQDVLVVTLVNSAVDNFTKRVSLFLRDRGQIPHLGYTVRTLHGLAHDIVRQRPEVVGLDTNFQIIDERAANRIRDDISIMWLQSNPNKMNMYLDPDLNENQREWVYKDKLPEVIQGIALGLIRTAKDLQLNPDQLQRFVEGTPVPLPLAQMGAELYRAYQQALAYRGAVDFDDLVRMALQILQQDNDLLLRLRQRWPYILEDEAQDSSRLQEDILRLLCGDSGNWVRVGDPNQAIYETFTTANPDYLRNFKMEADLWRELPNSGRSTRSIISLANHLIAWTRSNHPNHEVQDALSEPYIEPVGSDEEGTNPPDNPSQIHLIQSKYTPNQELNSVADSLKRWLPEHPEETVAILVPRNMRGFAMIDVLRQRNIEYVEILRSTAATRTIAGTLGNLLSHLSNPDDPRNLARIYEVWRREERDDQIAWKQVRDIARLLRRCQHVEDFVWPRPDHDWLDKVNILQEAPGVHQNLLEFRARVQYWQSTILLPIDQLILTLAQDVFIKPHELAIAHKLAILLRRAYNTHDDWKLPQFTEELAVIARNERRFLGFSEEDTGFDPDKHKGKVVVATIHKSKGLEWDRVYLLSVNNYDFPSGMEYDRYISEKWYIQDNLNLEAEAVAQLIATTSDGEFDWYQPGEASQSARLDYVKERLRLLFVGITRAKKEIIITWNTGRRGQLQPALPFIELQEFWDSEYQKINHGIK